MNRTIHRFPEVFQCCLRIQLVEQPSKEAPIQAIRNLQVLYAKYFRLVPQIYADDDPVIEIFWLAVNGSRQWTAELTLIGSRKYGTHRLESCVEGNGAALYQCIHHLHHNTNVIQIGEESNQF